MSNDQPLDDRPSVWGKKIPPRPPYFTGRESELRALRSRLCGSECGVNVLVPRPEAFYGLGGVGKTAIAVEYAYRYEAEYDIVWWVEAASYERIANSLIHLGEKLGLPPTERDKTPWVVQGHLRRKDGLRWLLIFDDANSPDEVQGFLPQPAPPGGHVIITSRVRDWLGRTGATSTEIGEFAPEEAVEYLRNRVPALGPSAEPAEESARQADAAKLAEALGHLPLAIVHAGAYLEKTRLDVDSYLREFKDSPHSALSKSADISYKSSTVAATWSMSLHRVGPDAQHLFRLLSFFAPVPVAQELLQRRDVVDGPDTLGDMLADKTRFQAALDELAGFSLVRFDGRGPELLMHRLVQSLTQEQTRIDMPEAAEEYRRAVHALLAASDPGAPDRSTYDDTYDRSLPHLIPADAINTELPALREMIVNQVRRLHLRGRHTASLRLGEAALKDWERKFGESDITVLRLATEVGMALRLAERHQDAYERNQRTLALAKRLADSEELSDLDREAARHVWLICANSHGGDLRFRGQFQDALELDLDLLPQFEEAFTSHPERTLNVRNNLAADYRRLGDFPQAKRLDEETYNQRKDILGPANPRTLASFSALARDLREIGEYERALKMAQSVCLEFGPLGERNLSFDLLHAHRGLAVALRRTGAYDEAMEQGRRTLTGYRRYLQQNHRYTLIAAANQIVDLRLTGRLREAEELGTETLEQCKDKDILTSSITFAAQVNLAAVLRQFRNPVIAQALDEEALDGLSRLYGHRHPFTIAARANLASDLFASGATVKARDLDEETLRLSQEVRSPSHPDTLAVAANLSIDMRATGDEEGADRLLDETLRSYRDVLAADHPLMAAAGNRQRITLDIEPY